jgi:RNA polymerase sigma-70 factor (ECF subfamily)
VEACDVRTLIERCVQGDDQAQALFYVEYANLVKHAVTRRLGSLTAGNPLRTEVEDICSEVFLKIFANRCRALTKLKKPQSIHAWLITLAHNHTVDYLRKWSDRSHVPEDKTREQPALYSASSEHQVIAREQRGLLEQCLAALSDEERLILDLFYVEGLKYAEIAAVTGLNINTASAKLRRAKLKLRKLLEDERHELTY